MASSRQAVYVIPPGADINEELRKAVVYESDLGKVKVLLSAGANAKQAYGSDSETLLHCARNIEIIKELVLHGANVNATNKYREPPLHTAVCGGRLEVIQELLKHGAWVNHQNRKGNTALNLAIRRSHCDLKAIKALLEHGADINLSNWDVQKYTPYRQDHNTPLDNAFNNPQCAKLLIKFTLIMNFDRGYKTAINILPYREWTTYNELSSYLEDCVSEIVQMKTDEVRKGLSLYQLTVNCWNKCVPYSNQLSKRLAAKDYSERYPIYSDIILKPYQEKCALLDKLSEILVYVQFVTGSPNKDDLGKKIILDCDCKYNIAEYLYNGDLSNLIEAFDKYERPPPADNSEESERVLSEPSTSGDCAKRVKLSDS